MTLPSRYSKTAVTDQRSMYCEERTWRGAQVPYFASVQRGVDAREQLLRLSLAAVCIRTAVRSTSAGLVRPTEYGLIAPYPGMLSGSTLRSVMPGSVRLPARHQDCVVDVEHHGRVIGALRRALRFGR